MDDSLSIGLIRLTRRKQHIENPIVYQTHRSCFPASHKNSHHDLPLPIIFCQWIFPTHWCAPYWERVKTKWIVLSGQYHIADFRSGLGVCVCMYLRIYSWKWFWYIQTIWLGAMLCAPISTTDTTQFY